MSYENRPEQAVLLHPHEMRRGHPCHVYRKVEDGVGDWVCTVCFPERFAEKGRAGAVTGSEVMLPGAPARA